MMGRKWRDDRMRLYDIGFFRSKLVGTMIAFLYTKTAKGKRGFLEFCNLCDIRYPIKTFNLTESQIRMLYLDHVYLRYMYGFSMTDYFLYELYRKAECIQNLYMSDRDRIKIHHAVNKTEYLHFFGDKKDFYEKFSEYMQNECIFVDSQDDEDKFRRFVSDKSKIVVKPRDGQRGIGVEIVNVDTNNQIKNAWEKCYNNRLLVEKIICGYDEIQSFHRTSLNTIRISTVLDPKGNARILSATIRTGVGDHVVDNGHSDGVYAAIDVDSGMISTIGYNANGDRFPVHPDSGKPFAGFVIPKWNELKQLSIEVAEIIPQMRYIGWDWALNSEGEWLLIEGNEPGGIDVHQHPGFVMKKHQYIDTLGINI